MGSIIQGAMGFLGQRQANEQQSEEFTSAQQFNANQAALNRTFQAGQQTSAENWMQMMSDTSMQRRVQDLKAAGLNPMLAIAQGGASTPGISAPGGAQASSPGQAQFGNTFAAGTNAYNNAVMAEAQSNAANAQAKKTTSETPDETGEPPDTDGGITVRDASHALGNAVVRNMVKTGMLTSDQADQVKTNIDYIKTQIEGGSLQNAMQSIQNYIAGQNAQILSLTKAALVKITQQQAKAGEGAAWAGSGTSGKVIQVINAASPVLNSAIQAAGSLTPLGQAGKAATTINKIFHAAPRPQDIPTLYPPGPQ